MAQMHCTTNSTLRRRVLLKILHMTRNQTTSASLLREVITGDSHGAPSNIVSYVNQVSILVDILEVYRMRKDIKTVGD